MEGIHQALLLPRRHTRTEIQKCISVYRSFDDDLLFETMYKHNSQGNFYLFLKPSYIRVASYSCTKARVNHAQINGILKKRISKGTFENNTIHKVDVNYAQTKRKTECKHWFEHKL